MTTGLAQDSDLDAPALEWLDRLLDAEPEARADALSSLAVDQPALHARLARLLAAVDDPGASRRIEEPFGRVPGVPLIAQGLHAGAAIGGYRLIRELGRGGMSVVWLAQRSDGAVKRVVALKMPLVALTSQVDQARFERERDVLAALGHPGIAALLDAGVAEGGQPFIALEFIAGQALDAACNASRLGLRERLAMFQQVLHAVDHAHKHLVVHRDLKPSNILVDAEGRVRLLDFGIAKLLDDPAAAHEQVRLTQLAGCGATPRYAAPEQIANGTITTATDIYSLGVILFELVCGVSPYAASAAHPLDCMRAVLDTPPTRPSRVADADFATACTDADDVDRWRHCLKGDLDNIVLKALSKDPAARYASVERMADDVQRFLDHRPVAARRPSVAHRVRLLVRRHRGVSIAAVGGLMAALAFGGVAIHQTREGVAARQRTEIVREFMFDLVDDAEADERQAGAEPTGRQMVRGAVVRARERFADQPRLRGEVLAELGRMQGRLGDDATAAGVLAEAVGLLTATAPDDDAPLNKARAYLAAIDMGNGRQDAAAALASHVVVACASGQACAKARYYAGMVMSRYEMRRGHLASALDWSERGMRESSAGFGPQHAETALALLAYAIVARQAGALEVAQRSLDQAVAMSDRVRLRLSDRIALSRTRAVLSLDLGHYAAAADALQRILPQARLASDRAVLWRLLATARLSAGEADDARAAADAAAREAGSQGVEPLLARQARARAAAMLGDGAAAVAEMARVIDGLHASGYADSAMEVMRARRYQAEARWRAGDHAGALEALRALADQQARVADNQAVEYAQSLDALGVARLDAGHASDALAVHQEAARLYRLKLPPDHPLTLRNALYAQLANLRPDSPPPQRAALASAVDAYAQRFAPRSLWRLEAGTLAACLKDRDARCATLL